jgi:hypothetical protein
MTKVVGSESISQRHGSADLDPDPPQNVMDPQHWLRVMVALPSSAKGGLAHSPDHDPVGIGV